MSKILKLPIVINKNNGQITTYLKQKQLPQKVLDAIREQPLATRRLLFQFKGVESD